MAAHSSKHELIHANQYGRAAFTRPKYWPPCAAEKDIMEKFTPEQFTAFLDRVEKLKSVPRHCVTSDGVQEYVAGHSWRVALMAYLMKDELGEIDIDKVIRMCLIHDLGEAVTGDIPVFEKTDEHEAVEKEALDRLLQQLPAPLYQELAALFAEMEALETKEATVYKALDKLEAVIQHNESDISTWLPLEYELQQTHAAEIVKGYPFLEGLQDIAVRRTLEKIAAQNAEQAAETPCTEAQKSQQAEAKAQKKQELRQQKAEAKQEHRQQKADAKQEKKNLRSQAWQERRREISLLTNLFTTVMLIAFIVLAIDQVGVYGFLGIWLFIALMAASVVILLAGIWRSTKKKRSGILITAAVIGILLCAAWFIYLFFTQGAGLGLIPS